MKFVSDIGISAEHPSVFWMFSSIDGNFEDFCVMSWRFLFLTDAISESDVSLTVIVRSSLRNMDVSYLVNWVDCIADGPAVSGCVGGAAIGTGGPERNICVKSGLFTNASSSLGLRFGICILKPRATLLEADMQERPEEITLMSSVSLCCVSSFFCPNFS